MKLKLGVIIIRAPFLITRLGVLELFSYSLEIHETCKIVAFQKLAKSGLIKYALCKLPTTVIPVLSIAMTEYGCSV